MVTIEDTPPKPSQPSDPHATKATASSSGVSAATAPAPPGHGLRRSFTVDESRRRPSFNHLSSGNASLDHPRRRSSNHTDYSLGDARDLLRHHSTIADDSSPSESSPISYAPTAFALLPAIAGLFIKNGSAYATDLMLLGIAAIFLHWSVTQPWTWYHSAQEVRLQHEADVEVIIEEDSDIESNTEQKPSSPSLDDVPEEESGDSISRASINPPDLNAQQQAALKELYKYEKLALLACFMFPLLSAYLLHAIRSQLSRPSEGLVSDYNLTIFAMASELRVFSHLFRLLQSRTLHLQRIVHANPYKSTETGGDTKQLDDLLERIAKLEDRNTTGQISPDRDQSDPATRLKQTATITKDVRSALQPELDALNRAVRRYEKKTGTLQYQTESRLSAIESRLSDAIALAAAAAKNSASHRNVLTWALEHVFRIVIFPFDALLHVLLLPLRSILALVNKKAAIPPPTRSRPAKPGRSPAQTRYSADRQPSRVTRK